MPQIVAVFLVSFWVAMAAFGLVAWYWALAGWFVSGLGLETLRRHLKG